MSVLYLALLSVILMACSSTPVATDVPKEEAPVAVSPEPPPYEEGSGPTITVTQEVYDNTLAEVRAFVNNLNSIIHSKNYNAWKGALSDGYFVYISSQEFLANASDSAVLRSQKIVLKTLNDYFLHVVVPSRSNSRVDEIEITSENRVKVYHVERRKNDNTLEIETRRLRLYELEKAGNTWKIID